jgi:hypothetical protein
MSSCRRSCSFGIFAALACALFLVIPAPGLAAAAPVLKGIIRDVDGRPVEGASVFVYATENTRRPPDFLSPPSGREGRYAVSLPHGRYWVLARAGKEQKTGHLLSDGRHSGDPAVIDVPPDRDREKDFTVAALREAARKISRTRGDVITVTGRIIDLHGAPVKGACVLVYRDREVRDLPDYVSAWADDDGRYAISLPPGTYCVGAAIELPLAFKEGACRRLVLTASTGTADVVMMGTGGK